ncbi:MAG: lipocalin family protein [Gammaproteobacteria bacterium]|nr:lipocalin family protein [Gammaproteobacteria bacterium]MDE2345903.1 lipocalin family protein [Gammaproteobacteria bacterium]
MQFIKAFLTVGFMAMFSIACASNLPPIQPVSQVNISRYMGKWYVIASIPASIEKHAYNALETYRLDAHGHIDTTYTFRNGSFNGKVKTLHSTGYIKAGSGNAVWGVQLIWPFRAQYIVAYLKDDYSQVIVARDARDYVWVMARTPTISKADYDSLVARIKLLGYSLKGLRKVPQQWPESPT